MTAAQRPAARHWRHAEMAPGGGLWGMASPLRLHLTHPAPPVPPHPCLGWAPLQQQNQQQQVGMRVVEAVPVAGAAVPLPPCRLCPLRCRAHHLRRQQQQMVGG
jgi:hypothetical protein